MLYTKTLSDITVRGSTGRVLCFICTCLIASLTTYSQSCPPNIDFEEGTFNGWTCYTGNVAAVNGSNVITLTQSGPVANRHTMMSSFPGDGLDPFGNFPVNCPNGSGHSIKLGNTTGGAEAEGVSYDFTIPANENSYDLIYHYAVVFQDPNHQQYEQPRMQIEVTNLTDNVLISCSSFAFFPYGTPLPGFEMSDNPGSTTPVWYKNWSAVSVNLDNMAGKRIRLFFKTADCTFRRHFGYAYIDVNSECSGRFEGASFCPSDSVVHVVAPYGYQGYTWYNSTFTQVLGTSQVLTFQPPPPTSMSVAVVLTPYNGYGCLDTLYTDITNNLVVVADAGRDTVSCNHNPVPIGAPPQLGVRYEWSPTAGLSNPNIANPLALPDVTTKYVVMAISNGGGCSHTDTVEVKASLVNNNIQVLGKLSYCIGSGDSTVLVVEPADSIQWYKDNVPIPGANSVVYKVTQSGSYYAILFGGNGCSLQTEKKEVHIATVPKAGFTLNAPEQCLFGNQFILKNTSTNAVGDMQYLWSFGDGNSDTSRNLTYNYNLAGNYTIKLVVTSIGICSDSVSAPVIIHPNAVASFSASPTCIGLPAKIINNTIDTIHSPVHYLWTFGNGQSSTLRNPPLPVYTQAGHYNINLSVSSDQCPFPVHTATHTIVIDRPLPGITYPVTFAVVNLPLDLLARRTVADTVLWSPAAHLDNPNSFTPVFKSNTEQLYTIALTTKSGCVTTDTQMVKLVSNIEIFVPNAFTPNGDGVNDELKPVCYGIKQLHYFRIYNRWGQLFFQSQDVKKGWDGTFKNTRQEMQTLVWMLEAVGVDGNIHKRQGTCLLIR
ncbi:MAG: gliding motility-associated C-terminal domain-containing protein [Bacteroidetes bacterium]|nr:gliding motility-associated C-terminal domain-containing protein [Bacteroidota bacterium]